MEKIQLTECEKVMILYVKGHLREKYEESDSYEKGLIPIFTEYYGWNPLEDNNYNDYLLGISRKLFDIYMKIRDWRGEENKDILGIIESSYCDRIFENETKMPIQRVISHIASIISITRYLDDNGVPRFDLTIKEE